ncbi:MAG: hypothetical protein ABSG43_21510 [Solirubrobacteraceae bacterium]|jgi:hypothetical protein
MGADPAARKRALEMNAAAAIAWGEAMHAHLHPPRDLGFVRRLEGAGQAARLRAQAARAGYEAGLRWKPNPAAARSAPPWELQPGTGRPGVDDLWRDFDRAAAAYNLALAGSDGHVVAVACDELADAIDRVCAALRDDMSWIATYDDSPTATGC